jgi:hypothetical protein
MDIITMSVNMAGQIRDGWIKDVAWLITPPPIPVKVSTPSRMSMMPTPNSMARPTRGGMTRPNKMIAPPTTRIVRVCPIPHTAPIIAEPRRLR